MLGKVSNVPSFLLQYYTATLEFLSFAMEKFIVSHRCVAKECGKFYLVKCPRCRHAHYCRRSRHSCRRGECSLENLCHSKNSHPLSKKRFSKPASILLTMGCFCQSLTSRSQTFGHTGFQILLRRIWGGTSVKTRWGKKNWKRFWTSNWRESRLQEKYFWSKRKLSQSTSK